MSRGRRLHRRVPSLVAASALLVSCAPAPDAGDEGAASETCVRMVTNSGGLEDRSFNQSSWEGLQAAEAEYGIEAEAIVSTGETDLAPNVEQAATSGCELVRHGRLRAGRVDARPGRKRTPTSRSRSSTRSSRRPT